MALWMLFGVLWMTAWLEYANSYVLYMSVATYYFSSDASTEGEAEVQFAISNAF